MRMNKGFSTYYIYRRMQNNGLEADWIEKSASGGAKPSKFAGGVGNAVLREVAAARLIA